MGLDEGAAGLLASFDWPGNVRELENAVFRAVALAQGPLLTQKDFPRLVVGHGNDGLQRRVSARGDRADKADQPDLAAYDRRGDVRPLADIEAEVIRIAVARYGGRMTMVARKLGISRSTLYRKLAELGLSESVGRVAAE